LKNQEELRAALSNIPGQLLPFLENCSKFRLEKIGSEWYVSLRSAQPAESSVGQSAAPQVSQAVSTLAHSPVPMPPIVKILDPVSAPNTPISVPIAAQPTPTPIPISMDANEQIAHAISDFLQTTNGDWFPLHALKRQTTLQTILIGVQGLQRLMMSHPNRFECRMFNSESQVRKLQNAVEQLKSQSSQLIPLRR
jgi:hypothetical protein